MKRPPKIELNKFQLAILLNDDQKEFYNSVIARNVFCGKCGGTCQNGMTVEEIYLDSLNDIYVKGFCNDCKGPVGRTFEFGENEEFYKIAMQFRGTISN